jgi:hypothetical protein
MGETAWKSAIICRATSWCYKITLDFQRQKPVLARDRSIYLRRFASNCSDRALLFSRPSRSIYDSFPSSLESLEESKNALDVVHRSSRFSFHTVITLADPENFVKLIMPRYGAVAVEGPGKAKIACKRIRAPDLHTVNGLIEPDAMRCAPSGKR